MLMTCCDIFVTCRNMFVTCRDICVTCRDISVTGRDIFVTGRDIAVTCRDIFVTCRDMFVTCRDIFVTWAPVPSVLSAPPRRELRRTAPPSAETELPNALDHDFCLPQLTVPTDPRGVPKRWHLKLGLRRPRVAEIHTPTYPKLEE